MVEISKRNGTNSNNQSKLEEWCRVIPDCADFLTDFFKRNGYERYGSGFDEALINYVRTDPHKNQYFEKLVQAFVEITDPSP